MSEPSYISHRVKIWDDWKQKHLSEQAKREKKSIQITLPDGAVKEGIAFETTPLNIAEGISKGLAAHVVIAKINGETLWDLFRPLEDDCRLELFKFDSEEGKKVFWHSSAHVLGQALEMKYGGNLCIGPATEEGFYYDMQMGSRTVTPDEIKDIQATVDRIIKEKQPYERAVLPKEIALEMFKENPYKVQIIKSKVPDGATCTAYRCGPLIDLCKGPHVPDTGRIKALAVTKHSSAYWLGKAENDPLQRVYGISFPDPKQLKEWIHFQEEAKKRDHRFVGQQQELFFFDELSPGSCFWLPHGTRIYNKLQEFIRAEYRKRGFTEVITPNMYSNELWKTSGHAEKYSENMFNITVEKQPFALKPMNCPGHCVMFKHRQRSHRELPIRFADFGVLHRNELSGALHGLTRVRRFQQDDAHIFCAPDQIEQEISAAMQFLNHVYGIFGFNYEMELSTRPEKFLGDVNVWDTAEKALEAALNASGRKWKLNPGDGAFYGPKIDIHIRDALNRSFQCATIQLDFQLPQRFDLQFVHGNNELIRPVIIHRAILGSVERFAGILIEHTGGKWPLWISPRQVLVISITKVQEEYCEKVRQQFWDAGFYADSDVSGDKLEKKVRNGQLAQYNYIMVCGNKEMEEGTVNVRTRDGKVHGTKTIAEAIAELQALVSAYQ